MTLYAFVGAVTGELLSLGGAVIVHDNPREAAFLLPGQRVIELPPGEAGGRPLLRLKDHPDMASVTWPLTKEQFR